MKRNHRGGYDYENTYNQNFKGIYSPNCRGGYYPPVKKIIGLFLAFTLLLSLMPIVANAYYVGQYGDLHYLPNVDNTITIIDCNQSAVSVIIPSEIYGLPVTNIRDNAFSVCDRLTSISIPSSVTNIDQNAFGSCKSLISINVNENNMFYSDVDGVLFNKAKTELIRYPEGKSNNNYTIPSSVTSIGEDAFRDCYLRRITIPNSVTSIDRYAFLNCNGLTSMSIPNSITSISEHAFFNCTSLKSINVNENNMFYSDIDGVLFNKAKTELIRYPEGKSNNSYAIPSSVTSIREYAFEKCKSLTSISIPNSMTSIGDSAFSDCESLIRISIPNSITSIDDYAFNSCINLTSINIPSSVTSIGNIVFWYCESLTSINIPSSVTSIGEDAFSYTGYYNNKNNWKNGALYIDNALVAVQSEQISNNYKINNGTTVIANQVFQYCRNLTSVTTPNTLISIGRFAFGDCTGLTSVSISSSVTNIDWSAFSGCTGLTRINVNDNNRAYSDIDGVLFNKDKTELVRYPVGKSNNNYTIPSSVTNIGDNAFDGCRSFTNINIPGSVTSIGNNAFAYCDSLTSIDIPGSVTSIGDYAFAGCDSFTSISIPSSVISIGDWAFSDCDSLTSISIPNSVTSIGDWAFSDCDSLTSISIPNSVTSIGKSAFYYCYRLTSISIPSSISSVGDSAFGRCSNITVVYYSGSKAEWEAIETGSDNEDLLNANIYYKNGIQTGAADYETEVLSYSAVGGRYIINSIARNNTENAVSCIMYSAVYAADGALKACGAVEANIAADDDTGVNIYVPCKIETGDTIKTFMWAENQEPLAVAGEVSVGKINAQVPKLSGLYIKTD